MTERHGVKFVITQKRFILLSAVILMFFTIGRSDENIGLCCLCQAYNPAHRMDFFIDDRGTTCRKLALEMADPTNDSKQGNAVCRALQSQHRRTCCDPTYNPVEIPQKPVLGDKNPYSTGKYNSCDLCSNGKYPGNPNTLVAVRNHPDPDTCKDLYWYALAGRIENTWCNPMRNYYEQPCGCVSGSTSPPGGGSGGGANDSVSRRFLQKFASWLARFLLSWLDIPMRLFLALLHNPEQAFYLAHYEL